jgi:hypothetical protein
VDQESAVVVGDSVSCPSQPLRLSAANDQVHAAGACGVDFNIDVAARSRATLGYPTCTLREFVLVHHPNDCE